MFNTKALYKRELGFEEVLPISFNRVTEKDGFIKTIRRSVFYNDEPKLFSYYTIFNKSNKVKSSDGEEYAGGTSLNKERAFIATLGEAIERYCLSIYKEEQLQTHSYDQVKNRAINIFDFINFSPRQLGTKAFAKFNFDSKTKFRWMKGYSLTENKEVLIPAQLVYVPYQFIKNEKMIREPISTGAASGTSLGAAIYRGICEIVERDAFMLTYLNRIVKPRLNLEATSGELRELYEIYKRYRLELHIVNLTTDISFPAHLGVLIDRTGLGPAVSLGLGADINSYKSALRAAEEAFHSRTWIRREMIDGNPNRDVCTTVGRGLYWSDIKKLGKIQFLLSGHLNLPEGTSRDLGYTPSKLKKAIKLIQKSNIEIAVVDLTTKQAERANFYVVKVLIAKLHPLYLDEHHPYLGGQRLKRTANNLGVTYNQLNRIPHPFL